MKIGYKLTGIFLIFTLSITLLFYLSGLRNQKKNFNDIALQNVAHLKTTFENLEERDTKILLSALEVIVQDPGLKKLYLEKSRDRLYTYAQPLFQNLKSKYGITHFYFILPDGRVFLRMHDRELAGDIVNRISFQKARDTMGPASEIELGKTAFALRAVMPYFTDGKLIGYVELGEGIDHFLKILHGTTTNQFSIIADKEYLNRDDWKSTRQVAGLRDNWDDLQNHLVLASTSEGPLEAQCFTEGILERVEKGENIFQQLQADSTSFICGGFELRAADGRHIGAVLSLVDITQVVANAEKNNNVTLLMAIILFIATFSAGILISRSFTRPIVKLAEVAKSIGEGDFNQRANVGSTDEIGQLGRTINGMSEKRKRAEERLKNSKELSDILNTINTTIHSTLDFDAIMKRLLEEAAQAIDAEASSIGLFQDSRFVIQQVYNLPESVIGQYALSTELNGIHYASSVKDVVAFADTYNDERLNPELMRKYAIRAMIVAPLMVKDACLGAMGFYCLTGPFVFSDIHMDFVRKLSASLSLALENARLYDERKKMEETMRHMAYHDALTGSPNRLLLTDIFALEMAQARRSQTKLAVLFLDLDRFKNINDTLGHDVGDKLLKEVAGRLKNSVRASDTVARLGGDEFNIILPNIAHEEDIIVIVKKIIDSFKKPYAVNGHEIRTATSIGISIYPDDAETMDILFKNADIAMYHAKGRGGNTYQFFDPAMNLRIIERVRMENWIRQALERGETMVYYQPQFRIDTRRLLYAEALVRWRHPERGVLDAKQFIPLAEEIGFITAIDEWVLRNACAQCKKWNDAGIPLCVTVNLSAKQFQRADLVERVSQILKETGLEPARLGIEITESIAMGKLEHTIPNMARLAEMGVELSIDDFGTGYSSLNYLKKLPIHRLKIDQSFVKDIATDPDDKKIVSAVTSLAHKMNLSVIAEGVETEEQLEFLKSIGCEEMQGYLFSRPLPPEEFEELIARK